MECPICLQICVHPSKLPCGHIFCFLCVKVSNNNKLKCLFLFFYCYYYFCLSSRWNFIITLFNVNYFQGLKNRRCAMCRTEFPIEFFECPELLQPIDVVASTSSLDQNEYQWFYKGRNGWWQYDQRTCQEIENAYKNGDKQCSILVAGYVYNVDFDHMLQQRQTDPSRKRQVKRDLATIPKKGVAGLRLPGTSSMHDDLDQNDHSSNIIATIAAAEAAIRIASDIIDSTLAHADEYHATNDATEIAEDLVNAHMVTNDNDEGDIDDARNVSPRSNSSNSNGNHRHAHGRLSLPSTSSAPNLYTRRELLDEIEETMNISNPSSINSSFGSTTTNLEDFFRITLDDFKHLALSNVADDSSDDDEEQLDNGDNFGDQTSTSH